VDPTQTIPLYRALHEAIRMGLVKSAVTPTRGGLAIALTRSALAGGIGAEIDLSGAPGIDALDADIVMFSESNGRFVVTVAEKDIERFADSFSGLPCQRIGTVIEEKQLAVRRAGETLIDVAIPTLRDCFKGGLDHA